MESQQFVAVVFVLFSAQGDLGGQAALQIVDQGIEAVYATPAVRFALGPPPRRGLIRHLLFRVKLKGVVLILYPLLRGGIAKRRGGCS